MCAQNDDKGQLIRSIHYKMSHNLGFFI